MSARKFGLGVVALAAMSMAPVSAKAAYQLFDNFDSYNTGTLSGQGSWTVPAQTATLHSDVVEALLPDKEAQLYGNSIPNSKPLSGLSIPNASTAATVYFNFKMAAAVTGNNFNFVITDVTLPGDTAGSSEVQFNFDGTQAPTGGTSTFRVRNAGAFQFLTTGGTVATQIIPKANIQYNAFLIINNSADNYQLYLQSDGDAAIATPTLITAINADGTGASSTFTFRNGAAANDLITANMGNGSTTGVANAVNFDDIYVDLSGANTVNPVPEPASIALLSLGAVGLLARRRRA